MIGSRGATLVLLDASPFYRFCEAQVPPELASYLRHNARITPEVDGELRRGASGQHHVGLRYLQRAQWPPVTELLPAEQQRRFLDYTRAARQKGDLPEKHAGEITTVLTAVHLGADIVVIDDLFGKRLARIEGQPRLSTAQLAAEMVVQGALGDEQGFRVFDLSTPDAAGRPDFERACERARSTET